MRKCIASFVMGLLLAFVALPLLTLADPTATHACCLARGAHHCAGTDHPLDEPSVSAPCPFRGRTGFVPGAIALLSGQRPGIFVLATRIIPQTLGNCVTLTFISPSGRAPPTLS